MAEYYEIKVKGHLDAQWSEWFAGLQLTHLEGNATLLAGWLPDQAALHGLLERIRDLNLTLISVNSDPSGPGMDRIKSKRKKENAMNARKNGSNANRRSFPAMILLLTTLLLVLLSGCAGSRADSAVLTQEFSEPLGDVRAAKFEINTDTGNLAVDSLTGDEALLASGTLEYLESQGVPYRSLSTINGQADLTWSAKDVQPSGFRLPWQACLGEINWLVHLNPGVAYDLTAHSGGGNVTLNLASSSITHLNADTGGGNGEVILPDGAASLDATVKTGAGAVTVEMGSGVTGRHTLNASSGAGEVVVRLPAGIAARIRATSGMGKVIMDSRFIQLDDQTYQSEGYESAADRVEMTLDSGAGNVIVETRN